MIDRPRRLVLLGHPVTHSLSPAFQNAALAAAGIPLRYEALDVVPADLGRVLEGFRGERVAGNVTIPHKAAAATLCDAVRPAAARTGAVNTFWIEHGNLVGDNTDLDGFAAMVAAVRPYPPNDLVVGIFGAGGAAAAVLATVERWGGCTAVVCSRSAGRGLALVERFRSIARVSDADELARRADLVVNATPIGLSDDAVPIDPRLLRSSATVLDLVYRPGETMWVRAARAAGLPALDGLTMLVEQGARAFELWCGVAPNREIMWEAVRRT